ncbi:MAG TPA: hypothetical protein VFZ59_16575, partial [Verrucomicrobiae bacterium]|nr:hypothetical protein [Verrucomicrobiae bacterium]
MGGLLWVNDSSTINSQPSTHFVAYDGNGNETARYEYGPFGDLTQASGLMARANPAATGAWLRSQLQYPAGPNRIKAEAPQSTTEEFRHALVGFLIFDGNSYRASAKPAAHGIGIA